MTEKYDDRDINVNRAPKKFFPIIGKLKKAVNRYIQTGREETSTSSNERSYFLFFSLLSEEKHVRLLRTEQIYL